MEGIEVIEDIEVMEEMEELVVSPPDDTSGDRELDQIESLRVCIPLF